MNVVECDAGPVGNRSSATTSHPAVRQWLVKKKSLLHVVDRLRDVQCRAQDLRRRIHDVLHEPQRLQQNELRDGSRSATSAATTDDDDEHRSLMLTSPSPPRDLTTCATQTMMHDGRGWEDNGSDDDHDVSITPPDHHYRTLDHRTLGRHKHREARSWSPPSVARLTADAQQFHGDWSNKRAALQDFFSHHDQQQQQQKGAATHNLGTAAARDDDPQRHKLHPGSTSLAAVANAGRALLAAPATRTAAEDHQVSRSSSLAQQQPQQPLDAVVEGLFASMPSLIAGGASRVASRFANHNNHNATAAAMTKAPPSSDRRRAYKSSDVLDALCSGTYTNIATLTQSSSLASDRMLLTPPAVSLRTAASSASALSRGGVAIQYTISRSDDIGSDIRTPTSSIAPQLKQGSLYYDTLGRRHVWLVDSTSATHPHRGDRSGRREGDDVGDDAVCIIIGVALWKGRISHDLATLGLPYYAVLDARRCHARLAQQVPAVVREQAVVHVIFSTLDGLEDFVEFVRNGQREVVEQWEDYYLQHQQPVQ